MNIFQRMRAYSYYKESLPDVDATKLVVTLNQTYTAIGEDMSITITATDAFDVRDYSYAGTITLTSDIGTILSGGSGTMIGGILTLPSVRFDTATVDEFVTASDGSLTDGDSSTFNVKYEAPAAITGLAISEVNAIYLDLTWTNPDSKNTLILAKKSPNQSNYTYTYTYTNEAGMDGETTWTANAVYGTNETPSDATSYVIYAGSATSIRMTNLTRNNTLYGITAYAYEGTLNSALQSFNKTETRITGETAY